MQTYGALVLLAFAIAYLGWRYAKHRATGNCCGEAECPAAAGMVERMRRGRTSN
jgi:hypothetical protein